MSKSTSASWGTCWLRGKSYFNALALMPQIYILLPGPFRDMTPNQCKSSGLWFYWPWATTEMHIRKAVYSNPMHTTLTERCSEGYERNGNAMITYLADIAGCSRLGLHLRQPEETRSRWPCFSGRLKRWKQLVDRVLKVGDKKKSWQIIWII